MAWVITTKGSASHTTSQPVLALPSLNAEVLSLDATTIARRGSGGVVVVRFFGPVRFVPHHFRDSGLTEPRTVEGWAAHLGAQLVFNAGQFDEALSHLGWLRTSGRWLSERRKEAWKGVLLSGGPLGPGRSWLADLDADAPLIEQYPNVVQSMMLLDEQQKLRVRDTDKSACRTVVAQDAQGRLLLFVTRGAVTLGDLARWISTTGLDISRAMNLDGGVESQLAIDTPELRLALYGQYGTGATLLDDSAASAIRFPIPAVIAVEKGP